MHNTTPHTSGFRNRQRGVGMIEVLITVLVLSVGLLGLAALQGISLQSNSVSYHRTQAVNLAHEVLDDIRANHLDPQSSTLDTAYWDNRAAATLPGGGINIAYDVANREATVTVTWFDDRRDEDSTDWSITIESTY